MFSRRALWPRAHAEPALAQAARAGHEQIAAFGDPVASGELGLMEDSASPPSKRQPAGEPCLDWFAVTQESLRLLASVLAP
jgi:hypothetical protein